MLKEKEIIKGFEYDLVRENKAKKYDEDGEGNIIDKCGNLVLRKMSHEKKGNYPRIYFGLLCENKPLRTDEIIEKGIIKKEDGSLYSVSAYTGKLNTILEDMAEKEFIKREYIQKNKKKGEKGGWQHKANPEIIYAFLRKYSLSEKNFEKYKKAVGDIIGDKDALKIFEDLKTALTEEDFLPYQVPLLISQIAPKKIIFRDMMYGFLYSSKTIREDINQGYDLINLISTLKAKKCYNTTIPELKFKYIAEELDFNSEKCPFIGWLKFSCRNTTFPEILDNYVQKMRDIMNAYFFLFPPENPGEFKRFVKNIPDHLIKEVYFCNDGYIETEILDAEVDITDIERGISHRLPGFAGGEEEFDDFLDFLLGR